MYNDAKVISSSRFYVKLELEGSRDSSDGLFLECQGLTHTQDAIEFCEVTSGRWGVAQNGKVVRTKLPGNSQSGNVTLRRGLFSSMTLWNWFDSVETGNWAKQRRSCFVTFVDRDDQPRARLELSSAWPSRYQISDVHADSADIVIEEIEITYEGFKRVKIGE